METEPETLMEPVTGSPRIRFANPLRLRMPVGIPTPQSKINASQNLLRPLDHRQQILVAVHHVIAHVLIRELVEEPARAGDLVALDVAQRETVHAALGLRNKEYVAYAPLLEGDGPVGRIVAHRRRDLKGPRQLGVERLLFGLNCFKFL